MQTHHLVQFFKVISRDVMFLLRQSALVGCAGEGCGMVAKERRRKEKNGRLI